MEAIFWHNGCYTQQKKSSSTLSEGTCKEIMKGMRRKSTNENEKEEVVREKEEKVHREREGEKEKMEEEEREKLNEKGWGKEK